MVDLDHFKDFNDRFGHLEGDHALAQVAALMDGRSRSYDIACRFGGEEFALVLPRTTLADAMKGADVFFGLSAKGAVTAEMVASMAPNPIIFAMADRKSTRLNSSHT